MLLALGWLALRLVALLHPLVDRFHRAGLPRWPAVAVVVVGALSLLDGLLAFAVNSLLRELPALQGAIESSVASVRDWLVNGPLQPSRRQTERGVDDLADWLRGHAESPVASAGTTASAAVRFLAGSVLALFVLVSSCTTVTASVSTWCAGLHVIWPDGSTRAGDALRPVVGLHPGDHRDALLDAVGIGIGLLLVGVPAVLLLTSLVFRGGFIPSSARSSPGSPPSWSPCSPMDRSPH